MSQRKYQYRYNDLNCTTKQPRIAAFSPARVGDNGSASDHKNKCYAVRVEIKIRVVFMEVFMGLSHAAASLGLLDGSLRKIPEYIQR